jgi:DNA/RNA-binding domain of Phe-tRNA-synthetase-like protein
MQHSSIPQIHISRTLLADFPDLTVMGFAASADPKESTRLAIPSASSVSSHLRKAGVTLEGLSAHPLVNPWRAAFQRSGLKPSTYKSSPEALARRILKGGEISTAIPLVDLYCAVSASSMAPLGAYDLDRLRGEWHIDLRHAIASVDVFDPIGGHRDDFPLKPTVPVYARGADVLCWAFNCRDSARSCLQPDSTRILFLGEALDGVQLTALSDAFQLLRGELSAAGVTCGSTAVANAAVPTARFAL